MKWACDDTTSGDFAVLRKAIDRQYVSNKVCASTAASKRVFGSAFRLCHPLLVKVLGCRICVETFSKW